MNMRSILENIYWLAAKYTAAIVAFGFSAIYTQGVFISEYSEGSGNNKYVEIYNGTGQNIDLSEYSIWKIANGGDWAEGSGSSAELSGSLAPGDVFVLCNASSDGAILSEADMTGTNATTFNGNDALGLAHNGVIIDAVGSEGADPGNGWDVAGLSNATANPQA